MRKVAFLVANDEFPEDDSIHPLRFPQNDATDLAEILGDKESCGFEPYVHINEPSYKVLEELYGISNQLTEDDTLLFILFRARRASSQRRIISRCEKYEVSHAGTDVS